MTANQNFKLFFRLYFFYCITHLCNFVDKRYVHYDVVSIDRKLNYLGSVHCAGYIRSSAFQFQSKVISCFLFLFLFFKEATRGKLLVNPTCPACQVCLHNMETVYCASPACQVCLHYGDGILCKSRELK